MIVKARPDSPEGHANTQQMPSFQLCQCISFPAGLSPPSADRHVRLITSLLLPVLVPLEHRLVGLFLGGGDGTGPAFSVTVQQTNQLAREALKLSDLPLLQSW